MTNPLSLISLKNPIHLLATGFGSGLAPVMPGTAGTIAAIPLFLGLGFLPLPWYLLMLVLTTVLGVWVCEKTSADMKVHDHGAIVWDEFVGYWLTMIWVPIYGLSPLNWHWLLTGFVLFRLFDMVKPWPISWLDKKVKGGFGIMVDDLLAGVMAAIGLYLIGYYCQWLPS